jgi:hypothetical protein
MTSFHSLVKSMLRVQRYSHSYYIKTQFIQCVQRGRRQDWTVSPGISLNGIYVGRRRHRNTGCTCVVSYIGTVTVR